MKKIYYAKTHADFLNQAFGTNYKAWMKGRWNFNEYTWVWIVRMDGATRDGWVNKIINENEIHELYTWENEPSYSNEYERPYRIAVQVIDLPDGEREYHVLGKYQFDFNQSTDRKHVLIKIQNTEEIYTKRRK